MRILGWTALPAWVVLGLGLAMLSLEARGQSAARLNSEHGIGSLDPRPSATLLLPYFEVDLDGTGTFLVRIRNSEAAPVVAHAVFWTDLARPTIDFDIYLSGFDTVVLDLGRLFRDGDLPLTGPEVLPAGPYSLPNEDFPDCEFPLPDRLPASLHGLIREVHTGRPSPVVFSGCGGIDHGDNVARGFLTLDAMNTCYLGLPGDPGYFGDGGTGNASNRNTLWGEYFWTDGEAGIHIADSLVHIEARDSLANGFWQAGDFTFYNRYLDPATTDNREPLPTTWSLRYSHEPGLAGSSTEILCWRDSGLADRSYFGCGQDPAQDTVPPYRLSQAQMIVFDAEENPIVIPDSPSSPPDSPGFFTVCPWATARISVGDLPMLFDEGWIYLNLNTTDGAATDPFKQSHLTLIEPQVGSSSIAHGAASWDNALAPTTDPIP